MRDITKFGGYPTSTGLSQLWIPPSISGICHARGYLPCISDTSHPQRISQNTFSFQVLPIAGGFSLSMVKRVRDIMHRFNILFPLYLGFRAADQFNFYVPHIFMGLLCGTLKWSDTLKPRYRENQIFSLCIIYLTRFRYPSCMEDTHHRLCNLHYTRLNLVFKGYVPIKLSKHFMQCINKTNKRRNGWIIRACKNEYFKHLLIKERGELTESFACHNMIHRICQQMKTNNQ